jgi:hypothetical protein
VQGNDPDRAAHIVRRSRARAHPDDLGITHDGFVRTLEGLAAYARAEQLDMSVVDLRPIDRTAVEAAWSFVQTLPRVD